MVTEVQLIERGFLVFYDQATKRNVALAVEGRDKGWLYYKRPSGEYVSGRLATNNDLLAILALFRMVMKDKARGAE